MTVESLDAAWATAHAVTAVAQDLAGEFSLRPLLERVLRRCTELLGCDAGSICSVDESAGTYRKEADIGIRCQSGQVFPLTEGMTGAVVARRGPLWFPRYEDVRGGHVHPDDRGTLHGVIGVPLEWRGEIIGVCVVFSRDPTRVFGPADAQVMELFAKHAAVALTNARLHDVAAERARAQATTAERERLLQDVYETLSQGLVGLLGQLDLARLDLARAADPADPATLRAILDEARAQARDALVDARRAMLGALDTVLSGRDLLAALRDEADWAQRAAGIDVRVVSAGEPARVEPALAHEILRTTQEALTNVVRHAQARSVRIGIAYEPGGVALLVQDDGRGFDPRTLPLEARSGLHRMTGRAQAFGGRLEIDSLPGWGTSLRARFPYALTPAADPRRPVRVLVVGPHPLPRAGIARLLTGASLSAEVVGELDSSTLDTPDVEEVDVVVAALEPGDGDLCRTLVGWGRPVVCVAGVDDAGLLVAAMAAGAHGCVDHGVDGPALVQAVLAAGRGETLLSATARRHLHGGPRPDAGPTLTQREHQVRSLIEIGLPDKLIATQLEISVKTVEKHVSSLLRKLGVHNRTELATLGHRR